MRYFKLLPLLLGTILIIFMYWKINNIDESNELSSALIDKRFPSLNLEILEGNNFINDLIGESFFIVNFFASWCGPCKIEHEVLKNFGQEYIIIGIGYKDTKDNIKDFISELGNPYKSIMLDYEGRAGIELGLYGVPETYFIGNDGKIKFRHVGPISSNKFTEIISLINSQL